MEKSIKLLNIDINYLLKINKRSKGIKLVVYPGGKVIVTVSRYVPQFIINKFLISKSDWIIERIKHFSKIKPILVKSKKEEREEYLKYKDEAFVLVKNKLNYFNKFYSYSWHKITIKNQKTRWGSCSRKGNFNFNYKIVLLPSDLSDYIIVHELCHLKELNHSKRFWDLVALTIPKYKEIRRELMSNNLKIN